MYQHSVILIVLIFYLTILAIPVSAEEKSWFSATVIDDQLSRAYQCAIVDINNDGKPDIAALGEGGESGVYWYENPSWKKRPISSSETTDHIDLAFYDLDDDGELEVAVASGFGLNRTESGGHIHWYDRTNDLDQPWTAHHIHSEPTAHRVRWANFDGRGKKELVVAPIVGVGTSGPDYDQAPVRLLAFWLPEIPKQDKWRMRVIDESLHILHGLIIKKNPSTEADSILTASLEGVAQLQWESQSNNTWSKMILYSGAPNSEGRPGSSEVDYGMFDTNGKFITTIEPWHGNQVVVYPEISNKAIQRHVIDNSFNNGHALATRNFDEDESNEIIAGYRGKGHTIYLYDYQKQSNTWERIQIDQSVAAQGVAVGDVNGDGKTDFVAAGGSTNNLKLYLNKK